MNFLKISFICFFIAASMQLLASPLSDARDAGMIKEMPSGFVVASKSAAPEIKKLVSNVNQKRKQAYLRIAEKHGLSPTQVGTESYKKRVKGNN